MKILNRKETLTKTKDCKHSVRYDNKTSGTVRAIYLMNEAYSMLERPEEITVTIERSK